MSSKKIKVKVVSRLREVEWQRYFPGQEPEWDNCQFLFSADERNYDWLIVYDDLPPKGNERFSMNEEILACARNNTLLVTTEPSNIKTYGKIFTSQFGHVLTSQEEWALPHQSRIFSQPALHWYYGVGPRRIRTWQEMRNARPDKSRQFSTVCANKQHMTKIHKRRNQFIHKLKTQLPEFDIFGRGVRPIDDKAEAIDHYSYHLAVENHIGKHHWTEKLSDSFLGLALPFYAGCPNAADYFPEQSFVAIDIFKEEDAIEIIKRVIHDNEYSSRLPAILEARRKLLEEYNFFAVVSGIIEERHQPGNTTNTLIRSRRAILSNSPLAALSHVIFKSCIRTRHWLGKN